MKYSDNKTVINLNSSAKVALFNLELLGQFSDGLWGNSNKKHWMWYNKATLNSDEGITADREYISSRNSSLLNAAYKGRYRASLIQTHNLGQGYACNNKELLECIGDRMLAFGAFGKAFNFTPSEYFGYFIEGVVPAIDITDRKTVLKVSLEAFNKSFETLKASAEENGYTKSKFEAVTEVIEKVGGAQSIVDGLNNANYTLKELRKDLREISSALKVMK
jgi:hypothetical protein